MEFCTASERGSRAQSGNTPVQWSCWPRVIFSVLRFVCRTMGSWWHLQQNTWLWCCWWLSAHSRQSSRRVKAGVWLRNSPLRNRLVCSAWMKAWRSSGRHCKSDIKGIRGKTAPISFMTSTKKLASLTHMPTQGSCIKALTASARLRIRSLGIWQCGKDTRRLWSIRPSTRFSARLELG